ncbi:hypothetical protein D3C85_1502180 [compost metagenome]
MQGASEQCMQATEMDFSALTTPSLIVTTRRRLTPQGTSCSFLQAVTQLLHSMQRSASQMNFMRAMCLSVSQAQANRSIWQTVVLVSCIIVTES